MDQIYPDDGLLKQLNVTVQNGGSGLNWDLYYNNVTPSLADTLATYQLASTGGYCAAQNLVAAAFTLQQVSGHVASIQAPDLVFTNTAGVGTTIYGYTIYESGTSKLIAAARFDNPLSFPIGGTIVVKPIMGGYSALSV
jgi:hypothetical protein